MEIQKQKCSSKEDQDINAISYCGQCNIYMCNKCEKFHTKLFSSHQIYNLEKQTGEIFTGFCKEKNHLNKLEFFCKTHNSLCCAVCLCKIEKNGIGLHKDCDVCFIEDIKEEKKNKINENIKYLEEISNTIQDSFDKLKITFEEMIKNKEELKLKIENTFTKIRSALNNREDELLLEVDKQFNDLYCDEKIFEKYEKLPKNIKILLEKGKKIEFNEDKLISFINDCINIENNIEDIKKMNENIEKIKNETKKEIKFSCESDDQLNLFLENIQKFGKIFISNFLESLIIKDDFVKQNSIINWIKEKINKNSIKLERIFIMSINGSSSTDFHNYCDNKGPTLTIVQTTKNKIFGGFTPLNWDNSGGNKIDKNNQTFIFSLDLLKKYDLINKEKEAIYCNKQYGPYFGGRDFSIESNMKRGKTFSNKGTNFISNNNLDMTGGKGDNESFDISDFEVFKVIY